MRQPDELDHAKLASVVAQIRDLLFLDIDEAGAFYNPDKEWSADTLEAIAGVLYFHRLAPDKPPVPG